MGEILANQEDMRKMIKAGIEEQHDAFDEEHQYNSKNFKHIEDDMREIMGMKRKSDQMDQEAEYVPEE
eukprot:14634876-Heterocapsa_arctica.AAC.1